MISGRGLGHTGGTLDKMDSISGYNTSPDIAHFQKIVAQTGCAIVGQTAQLAPADKKLYGIRDVTATVESIPLITASILSKKLSAGLDALVMDVKVGSGAFAASQTMAKDLASNIVEVGQGLDLPVTALITDMSQVLGLTAGNALEISEVIDYLKAEKSDPRLHRVVLELGAELLLLSGLSDSLTDARGKLERSLQSGLAAEYFARMVSALGGPADLLENSDRYLASAPVIMPLFADQSGQRTIAKMDVRALGNAVVELGGGRTRPQDSVDHSVGLSAIKGLGEKVSGDEPLMVVHANSKADAERAIARIRSAITYTEGEVPESDVLMHRLAGAES